LRSPRNMPVLAPARSESVTLEPMPQIASEDQAQPGLSLAQIFTIAWAYRLQILAITAAIFFLVAVIIKFIPKTYEGKATLMVSYESNDPLGRGVPTQPVQTYISTEMELMRSSEVLLPVVDKLNLTADEHYTAGFNAKSNGDIRDWAKEVLSKYLEIEQGRFGSQLIYVTASARDPVLAATIANTVADIYLEQERNRVSGPASERAKNYAQELAELKHKVTLAQEQVTAFRQRTGETDSASQAANVEADLLASLELRYQEAQNLERAAEVAVAGRPSAASTVVNSTVVQGLRTQLDDQNKQLAQLRSTMGPAHPKIIEMENQIAATRRSISEETAALSSNLASQLDSARQMRQKLATAVEQQRAKVLGVRKLQDEGTKYVVELESAQSVYKRALDGYDQIMFASGDNHTNVNFVSRALPAPKAIRPNKIKMLLAGALASLLIGFAAPFAYELVLNRRVRCRDDFERGFGVPVLSEFDAIKFAPSSV
jgi:polysaccharide biosynthesis transport protein